MKNEQEKGCPIKKFVIWCCLFQLHKRRIEKDPGIWYVQKYNLVLQKYFSKEFYDSSFSTVNSNSHKLRLQHGAVELFFVTQKMQWKDFFVQLLLWSTTRCRGSRTAAVFIYWWRDKTRAMLWRNAVRRKKIHVIPGAQIDVSEDVLSLPGALEPSGSRERMNNEDSIMSSSQDAWSTLLDTMDLRGHNAWNVWNGATLRVR